MGVLKLPFLILWRVVTLGAGQPEIRQIADRIARFADRFANAGDGAQARLARGYSLRASLCFTAAGARAVEEEFLVRIGMRKPRMRPVQDDDSDRDRARDTVLPSAVWPGGDAASGDASSGDSSSGDRSPSGGGHFGGAGASGSWDDPGAVGGSDTGGPAGESFTDNS
jgi:uncharacterized membrane protein YgcG